MRNITLYPVLNGWVIKCGCQMVAFTDKEKLLKVMRDWLSDPAMAEKAFIVSDGINAKFLPGLPEMALGIESVPTPVPYRPADRGSIERTFRGDTPYAVNAACEATPPVPANPMRDSLEDCLRDRVR